MMRLVAGFVLAAVIAAAATRTRSLSTSGAVAAAIAGTLAIGAGWSWGGLLIVYFVSSTVLSHIGRPAKDRRTAAVVAKGSTRDAAQVLANGGTFAAAALGMLLRPDARWIALGAGSLGASAADTWATEIGTLLGGEPRSILPPWRPVPAGTSGGVSAIGTIAAVGGACFMSLAVLALGWTHPVAWRVATGGIAGAFVDSVLGATLQAKRWCDTCQQETERLAHTCGTRTRRMRGLDWLDNDMVNFVSNAAGGLVAVLLP
jgi:uncharacterized protein (TIGR00297 family)